MKIQKKKHTRKLTKNIRRTRKQRGAGLCTNLNTCQLGKQVFGSTWPVYENINNEHVLIKEFGPAPWLNEEMITNEINNAIIASKLEVGPHIYSACIKHNKEGLPIGYLIMDRIIGKTFQELYDTPENIPPEIFAEYKKLMDILYDEGMKYLDRHLQNFMYGHTSTNPEDRVWIIDFGEINEYPPTKRRNYRFNL
jgi:hypothetical protein